MFRPLFSGGVRLRSSCKERLSVPHTRACTGGNRKGTHLQRNANDAPGDKHRDKNTLRAQNSHHCECLAFLKQYKRWLQSKQHTVANSQQSAIIQSTPLLIILFQEKPAAAEAKKGKKKQQKRHVPGREKADQGRAMTLSY